MGLWIYLSGVLIIAVVLSIKCYSKWNDNIDITVGDIFFSVLISILSWIGIILLMGVFIEKHCNDVVIEGKKLCK